MLFRLRYHFYMSRTKRTRKGTPAATWFACGSFHGTLQIEPKPVVSEKIVQVAEIWNAQLQRWDRILTMADGSQRTEKAI